MTQDAQQEPRRWAGWLRMLMAPAACACRLSPVACEEEAMTQDAQQEPRRWAGDGAPGHPGRVDTDVMVASAPPGQPAPVGAEAPVMQVLATMRAMRRLKPDPVPRETLERLVEAATWAPSAGNEQLYSYVVVTDRAQIALLGTLWRTVEGKYLAAVGRLHPEIFSDPRGAAMYEAVRYQAEHFDQTPAVIAVCYTRPPVPRDPRLVVGLARAVGPSFLRRMASPRAAALGGASSSYPGVQNLLLAARALGLAANISIWHLFAENQFKQVLGVPRQVTIYALVPVGWPAGHFGPVRRRPVADVVHWDRWQASAKRN